MMQTLVNSCWCLHVVPSQCGVSVPLTLYEVFCARVPLLCLALTQKCLVCMHNWSSSSLDVVVTKGKRAWGDDYVHTDLF
jgi:hypothetical protein